MSKIKIQYIKEPETVFESIAKGFLAAVIVVVIAIIVTYIIIAIVDVIDNNSKLEQLLKRPVQQRIIVMPPMENFPLVPNTEVPRFGGNLNENITRITN